MVHMILAKTHDWLCMDLQLCPLHSDIMDAVCEGPQFHIILVHSPKSETSEDVAQSQDHMLQTTRYCQEFMLLHLIVKYIYNPTLNHFFGFLNEKKNANSRCFLQI